MGTFSIALKSGNLAGMDIYEIRKQNLVRLIGKQRKGACALRWEMSPAHLSQILSEKTNKNLGDDVARRIELLQGLSRGWMDVPHAPMEETHSEPINSKEQEEAVLIGDLSPWDDSTPLEDDEVELPLYKEVELAAGTGRTAVQEMPGRKLRFSYATLRAAGVDPAAAVCAQLKGNSMEPLILNGATIGIDKATTRVVDGEIYALEHDGMLRVKYLYRLPGGGLRLRSFNRDEYGDEEYTPEDLHAKSISIIGWVFWWSTLRTRGAFRR